ncbi:hypothetical protein BI081_gp037 [Mycobacterium phage Tonenili]|uniref:Uncharacterized protein n=1 Tax=Mycobacterium phage Tonenili TaxID=1891703 RepID=A0A1C9EH15_9CAUD|nr:hypothetical protein BI081_gp037 [Mycobacterium phage Tonenili]AON96788.1 hypothetical protein SEA_TONENILI_37 [Mycobacterium phage Tonenili]
MSTKLYVYRVPKSQWWDFYAAVRRVYLDEHLIARAVRGLAERKAPHRDVRRIINESVPEYEVELQLFDDGEHWIVRPLESGWFFTNQHHRWLEFGLVPVFYDDRADVPPEHEANKVVADWVDKQIETHRYLMAPVLNRDAFFSIWIDALYPKAPE